MPRIFLIAISLFALFIVFAVDGIAAGPETRQISLENEGVLNVYARWAASLRKKNDEVKAAEVEDQAKKLEHAFRSPESTYLGFDPSKDLKAYGDSLPGERYLPIYAVADSYKARQLRNVKSWGAKVWDLFRYYAPKE